MPKKKENVKSFSDRFQAYLDTDGLWKIQEIYRKDFVSSPKGVIVFKDQKLCELAIKKYPYWN